MFVIYIGFVVATLVLVWGLFVVGRRYFWRRKIDSGAMHTWVPLQPATDENSDEPLSLSDEDDDHDEDLETDLHTRARQNGHHSESKSIM